MIAIRAKIEIGLAVTVLAVIGGLFWYIHTIRHSVAETPKTAVRQGDGSLVLQRTVTTPVAQVKVPHKIPVGTTLQREEQVFVQPTVPDCPKQEVDLSLVKAKDNTERVVASSPTGTVTGGLDIPTAPEPQVSKPQHWQISAMAGVDTYRKLPVYGGQVEYRKGVFTVGAGVIGYTVFGNAGIHF